MYAVMTLCYCCRELDTGAVRPGSELLHTLGLVVAAFVDAFIACVSVCGSCSGAPLWKPDDLSNDGPDEGRNHVVQVIARLCTLAWQ
jgi:hypothetical protein